MIALLLFGLVAGACAAPNPQIQLTAGTSDPPFDTIWKLLNKEIKNLCDMMNIKEVSTEGIVGNKFRSTMYLKGFDERDIAVIVREGLVTVQATHTDKLGKTRSQTFTNTLPPFVNLTSTWVYEQNALTITYPLKPGANVIDMYIVVSVLGIVGNKYVLGASMLGYDEKNIIVMAREGQAMIQATVTNNLGKEFAYTDTFFLPDYVNPAGSWVYEQNMLKLTFPLKPGAIVPEVDASREEPSVKTHSILPVTGRW